MTDPQPIQTTAAVAHLRYTARRVAINERCVEKQVEWLAADLIERQEQRIAALTEALEYVASLRTGGQIEARCRAALEAA